LAKFKVVISDPEKGDSKFIEIEEVRAVPLIGRKLGDLIDGSIVGLPGNNLQITGGSDRDGFPMRPNIHGGIRIGVILSGGVGFRSSQKGKRKRKTVRGNVITEEIVQLNMKIVEQKSKKKGKGKKSTN
jgi:small subunit ribosomal protein S6e